MIHQKPRANMKSPPTTLVLTCTGNVADEDLEDRLAKITAALKDLSETDDDAVNLSKVEPWNSVRVTFNIPPEAAARLRELAQRGDPNLHKLGILSVQVENGDAISLPPPPTSEAQRSLFSPLPSTPSSTPQLSQGTPIVPPSPSPVMASPLNPSSTVTPATMVAGLAIGSGGGLNFPMPGVSLQQLTRPPLQGLPGPGPGSLFPQQGAGNLWNTMNAPQQRPLQPPSASFWNQIPQFFPQVNMAQTNQQPNIQTPTGPSQPTAQQAKPPAKKRRKRTKKANIQPPELAVAAGQPLLPLPAHLQSLPPTTTPDNIDSFNTSKPSNLILPPSLIDNPISPNSPPSSSTATSVMPAASAAATSTAPCTQFSFTEIPMSRGLVTSPQTQQMQLLQKKTDVALTSPLLVNLLQSDISSKQFPLANTSGGKTIGTVTPTTGQLGPFSQESLMATPPTTALSTSSPFTIGNSVGTLVTPNSTIPNSIPPLLTSQGNILSQISTSNQFLPTNPLLQANIGHLSQEQIQFQLSQLTSAGQFTQAQMQHSQFMQGHISQSPLLPGQNQVQPGNMQTFPMPGGHHSSSPSFPPQMSHIQLPNVRMSIGPISNAEQIAQGQVRPGFMHPGQMPRNSVPIDPSQLQQNNLQITQAEGQFQPNRQLEMIPSSISMNQMDTWSSGPTFSSSADQEKQRMLMELQSKKPKEPISGWNGNDKPTGPPKPKVEVNPAFDEEAALRGMTEAERDTMAAAAVIAREAKEAADAKNGKQSPSKDVLPSKSESQPGDQAIKTVTASTTSGSLTESSGLSTQLPKSVPSANIASPVTSLPESQFDPLKAGQLSSRVGPQTPSSTERRLSNSPVRLSPPKMPESIKQRRTPPSSAARPSPHPQGHYGPISGGSPTSMSSSIAGLQTLTSRTFAPSAQPSIRDMALSRNNPEHNTLSQFLSSVTPPSEILQMAPLYRSTKQQETPPKPMLGVPPSSTASQSDWLSLPAVEGQKPLPALPSQIGARTPMQPAEFSAATERMLGSMLDTQKSNISNIERPANQPRVITTEGIKFMHQLVGRPPPTNTTNQGPAKDSSAPKDSPQEPQEQTGSAKQDDKSQLKALLNEIVNPEKSPMEAKLQVGSTNVADDKNVEKFPLSTTPTSRESGPDVRQPSTTPPSASHHGEPWLGIPNPGTPFPQASRTKVDTVPQPSNITSMYIPPSTIGNQQQRAMFNRPSTEQQLGTSSTTTPTAATFETSHLASLSPFSGLVGEGSKSGPFKNLKDFDQTSQAAYLGQPHGTLPQAMAGQDLGDTVSSIEKKETQFSHVAEGSATNSPALKLVLPSQHQLQTHSFPTHLPTKSHVPQQPSLQETPMTVLERAPEILLSPTTLSTASKELLESLAAHGTVSALPSAPETMPGVGGRHGPGSEQITQKFQGFTASKPEAQTFTAAEIPHSSPEVPPANIGSNTTTVQTAPGTTPNAYSSVSVALTSSTPAPPMHTEHPADKPGITSQVVVTTAESSVASVSPIIPTAVDASSISSTSVSAFTPVQQSSEVTDMKQMSLMPLSQLVAATHGPLQSHLSSQPKATVPITQSLPSLPQPPVSQQSTVNMQGNTVLTGEKEQNDLQSQVPKPALQSENLREEPPSYQQSYPTSKLSENMSKTSQDEVKRVEPESPSKGVVGEADTNSQQVYTKPSGEKRLSQLRLSPKAGACIGHSQGPQTTSTSPVKPSIYTSASSTLAQAQSIMVKTAAMSRASGIMKATEQMSRPVRSRTPPRASLSTLPPTTCNNDSSLGSASALLSSIAKSAWTVTTAMASAAKAKVVPTPKATDKNLIRMRRSPETLPPAGKMAAGDRERGSSSHETGGLHARQTPNAPAFKNIAKTPTDSSADQMQLMMKTTEGSPGPSRVQIDQPNVTQRDLQFSSAGTKPTVAITATTSETVQPTKSLAHSFSSNRIESESIPATRTSPVSPRHIASSLSSSFSTANPVLPTHPIVTTTAESQLSTRLKSTKSFIDFTEDNFATPFALAQQAQQQAPPLTETLDGAKLNTSPAESFTFGEWQLGTAEKRAPSDDQKAQEKISMLGQPNKNPAFISSTKTASPEEKPHSAPKAVSPRGKSPITDTSAPIVPCSTAEGDTPTATPAAEVITPGSDQVADKSNQDTGSKEPDQSVGTISVEQESDAVSPSKSEIQTRHDPSIPAETSRITPIPTPTSSSSSSSPPEHRKRPSSENDEEPPAKKIKGSSSTLTKDNAQNLTGTPQKVEESISNESLTPEVTGETLLKKDIGNTEGESIKILPNTVKSSSDVVEVPEQNKLSEDKQEEQVPAGAETATRPQATVSEVTTTEEAVKSSAGDMGNPVEETPKFSVQQEPNQSCEVGMFSDTDVPMESSLLNKPDQITILVEEVIQKDPESEELFDKSSSECVSDESSKREVSGTDKLEVPSAKSPVEEPCHSENISEKEQSKEGGTKPGKDAEGEFEPRRTRHTSEEVPGMSLRSLRSGRRSPAEQLSRGKDRDKEESPPTTRGRGQKDRDMTGDVDSDGSSRKRSTRSSGRDMYYGPIPSYKRRKMNQK